MTRDKLPFRPKGFGRITFIKVDGIPTWIESCDQCNGTGQTSPYPHKPWNGPKACPFCQHGVVQTYIPLPIVKTPSQLLIGNSELWESLFSYTVSSHTVSDKLATL